MYLDFSHKAIRELLFNAVEGNEACIDLLDKFDKAMNQLGYPSVNTKGVIEEVRSLCEAHNIPIAMALIKPKDSCSNIIPQCSIIALYGAIITGS